MPQQEDIHQETVHQGSFSVVNKDKPDYSRDSKEPVSSEDDADPDALIRCFYQDPWWEDLTAYINQAIRRRDPRARPLSTTVVMNINLDKLRLFDISTEPQSKYLMWSHILAITSTYVESCHKVQYQNVPELLPQLYAVCLYIDLHSPRCVLYRDDTRRLMDFLDVRLMRRSSWAVLLGESEIDFSEYERRYLPALPVRLSQDAAIVLRRKPEEQNNNRFVDLTTAEAMQRYIASESR